MAENKSITCDECGKELIEDSQYPHKYGLRLTAIDHGINTSGATYAVHVSPPIDRLKDFCGLPCLASWVSDGDRPKTQKGKCYPIFRDLLQAGYAVELRPEEGSDSVTMTVVEARNGNVQGVEVELGGFEWLFSEQGLAERLEEARQSLLG